MASANRCPQCKETIHPFAALCPSCGADLDAHRRRLANTAQRTPRIQLPRLGGGLGAVSTEDVVLTLVMLLLALFAPLFGALFALFIVWHASTYGPVLRRNIAIGCAALAIFDLVFPSVLYFHLIV